MSDISTAISNYTQSLGASLSDESGITPDNQLARIQRVAEIMSRGERGTKAIMALLQCSRPTAIRYRNHALQLLAEERKPLNREHMRNLEMGRVEYWIDDLSRRINEIDWSNANKLRYQQYGLLLTKLKEQTELLHKLGGLQTEVVEHTEEKRRIVFVRSAVSHDVTSDDNHVVDADHIIEGEVIQNGITPSPESR